MTDARLFPRGFCLSPIPVAELDAHPAYSQQTIGQLHFYSDELTEVDIAVDGDGWVIVVGKAWPLSTGTISPQAPSVAAELLRIAGASTDDGVETALYDIAGRFAVILGSDTRIAAYTDAGATRSVYFNPTERKIASHYAMLTGAATTGKFEPPFPGAGHGREEANWDLTEHTAVFALLANMRLELLEGRQVRYGLVKPNPYTAATNDERLDVIDRLWHEQVHLLVAGEGTAPLGLSMSGGLDSRTMLAFIREHRDVFRAFTYTSPAALEGKAGTTFWAKTMASDFNTVMQMKEFLPTDHRVFPKDNDKAWAQRNAATLAKNSPRQHGQWLLPHYLELFPNPRTVHYRGNIVGLFRMPFASASGQVPRERILDLAAQFAKKNQVEASRVQAVYREKFDEMQYDRIHQEYDETDALYWETRLSRWYGEVLNETDVAFDTITPVNVRRLYDAFLSFAEPLRQNGFAQYELIHRNWPALSFFPVNAKADLYERFLRPKLNPKKK